MNEFDRRVAECNGGGALHAATIRTIQVNVGLVCNQICFHCHVNSSPYRKEAMGWETMQQVIDATRHAGAEVVDITGGAPEMNPDLKRFIGELRAIPVDVMVRSNLTILVEEGWQDFPEFFRDHRVQLVASLPCYLEDNVDQQRGNGVFQASIKALRRLNDLGYGTDPALPLSLVYNPVGAHLPPAQAGLEEAYRDHLGRNFDVTFTNLFTITNMPIGRFQVDLRKQKKDERYKNKLRAAFNPETVEGLMCRHQISVRWDGTIFDCDFNLALKMPVNSGAPRHIGDFAAGALRERKIATAFHCFGCTAGAGSSCGGALLQ